MATKMVWQHEVFFCDAYALGGKRDLQVQEKVLGLGKELNVDPVYSRTQIRMPQWLLSLLIPVAHKPRAQRKRGEAGPLPAAASRCRHRPPEPGGWRRLRALPCGGPPPTGIPVGLLPPALLLPFPPLVQAFFFSGLFEIGRAHV